MHNKSFPRSRAAPQQPSVTIRTRVKLSQIGQFHNLLVYAKHGREIGVTQLGVSRGVGRENRRITETTPDRFPNAPRLDPLRSALAKLDPVEAAALTRPPAAKNGKPAPQSPQPQNGAHGAPETARAAEAPRRFLMPCAKTRPRARLTFVDSDHRLRGRHRRTWSLPQDLHRRSPRRQALFQAEILMWKNSSSSRASSSLIVTRLIRLPTGINTPSTNTACHRLRQRSARGTSATARTAQP